jgi:hypothetical protein
MRMASDDFRIRIALAGAQDRAHIYRIRHHVYAEELHQHPCNAERALSDRLDRWNLYIIATCGGVLLGFISITPPGSPSLSIDKYFVRAELPFIVVVRLNADGTPDASFGEAGGR